MTLNYGSLYVEQSTANEILLAVENWALYVTYQSNISDLPAENFVNINLEKIRRVLVAKNMYFKTQADAEALLAKMDDLNKVGSMNIRILTVSGSYFNFLATKTTFPCFCTDIAPMTKVAYGAGTVYKVGQVKWRQISAVAT